MPRVYYLPTANVMVVLPESNDRIVLRRFNLAEVLNESQIDHLFVRSPPPVGVQRTSNFNYQLDVLSSAGDLAFTLESGPKGMSISKTGLLDWRVPAAYREPTTAVIISIMDGAREETLHSFILDVED